MLEKNRSHIEIVDQLYATRKAINMVGIFFMKNHLAATVSDVMRSDKKKKEIDDFMNSVHRFIN